MKYEMYDNVNVKLRLHEITTNWRHDTFPFFKITQRSVQIPWNCFISIFDSLSTNGISTAYTLCKCAQYAQKTNIQLSRLLKIKSFNETSKTSTNLV